eukprot:SAG11_NODE_19805_length_458_cov_1.704735_1_plen_97_part_01
MGFVNVAASYGIPGLNNFTFENLANGISCEDDDCIAAMIFVMLMGVGGAVNQFAVARLDMTVPPTGLCKPSIAFMLSPSDLLQKIEKIAAKDRKEDA